MAGSTYLDLVNLVIRRINEVELTQTSFASSRGIQSVVKDVVKEAIYEINQQKWEWPYHAVETTQLLVKGTSEYLWPTDFKSADWESFEIQKNSTFGTNNKQLKLIDRNEWYTYFRDIDRDNDPNGLRVPQYVFKSHTYGFGITPAPNNAYSVKYRYYRQEPILTLFSDTTDIPERFNNIIVAGALYHMNLFKEDVQGVTIAQNAFTSGIKNMYSILVGEVSPYATTTVVSFSGLPTLINSGNYKP